MKTNFLKATLLLIVCFGFTPQTGYQLLLAQSIDVRAKLGDFDSYMEKIIKDWNSPGVGVGIVVKDRLVFAKGYGYRDYEKKLPVTPSTLFQIASNTKLFTTMAVGLLVEEGKLDWDKPIRQYVPSIQFYNQDLENSVTIRDMLSHRTGISRHDMIWYRSDFTRKELFDRIRYLEPSQPIRQGQLYNNIMYAAAGYIVQLLTQRSWENFVRERLFAPLGMSSSVFSIEEMMKQPDHFVPYNEKRDTTLLYRIPYYQEAEGIGPAGSIVSNIDDMSKWLIALMNDGAIAIQEMKDSVIQVLTDFHVTAGTSIRRNLLAFNILKKGKEYTQERLWSAINELCNDGVLEIDKYDSGNVKRMKIIPLQAIPKLLRLTRPFPISSNESTSSNVFLREKIVSEGGIEDGMNTINLKSEH